MVDCLVGKPPLIKLMYANFPQGGERMGARHVMFLEKI